MLLTVLSKRRTGRRGIHQNEMCHVPLSVSDHSRCRHPLMPASSSIALDGTSQSPGDLVERSDFESRVENHLTRLVSRAKLPLMNATPAESSQAHCGRRRADKYEPAAHGVDQKPSGRHDHGRRGHRRQRDDHPRAADITLDEPYVSQVADDEGPQRIGPPDEVVVGNESVRTVVVGAQDKLPPRRLSRVRKDEPERIPAPHSNRRAVPGGGRGDKAPGCRRVP